MLALVELKSRSIADPWVNDAAQSRSTIFSDWDNIVFKNYWIKDL